MPELIIRSRTEHFAPEALPELFMRLCETEIHRRIAGLKSRLDDGEEIDLKELYHLEQSRRDILRKIHAGTYETI